MPAFRIHAADPQSGEILLEAPAKSLIPDPVEVARVGADAFTPPSPQEIAYMIAAAGMDRQDAWRGIGIQPRTGSNYTTGKRPIPYRSRLALLAFLRSAR